MIGRGRDNPSSVINRADRQRQFRTLPEIAVKPGCHVAPLRTYLARIKGRSCPVGRKQIAAVERFERDRKRYQFDCEAVDRVVSFFPQLLRHTTGEFFGEPFELRPWQVFIVANLYGFMMPDGSRRFREAFISVARGNGKSPFGAGLAIYNAYYDGEPRAEVCIGAPKSDQARIIFQECRRFVQHSLLGHVQCKASELVLRSDDSRIYRVSSDRAQSGGIPSMLLLDELHEWRARHRDTYSGLVTGLSKRRNPLLAEITTAGDDLSVIYLERMRHVHRVLSQPDYGHRSFVFVSEIDADQSITRIDNYTASNPMLQDPRSPVKREGLAEMIEQARGDLSAEMRLRRFHANQQVAASEHLFAPGEWAACDDWEEPRPGVAGYGAFDLGHCDDFAAVATWHPVSGGRFAVEAWCWTTEQRSSSLRTAEFQSLVGESHLFVCPGDQVDFASVRQFIEQLAARRWVARWGYDPAFATETAGLLEQAGCVLEPIKQTGSSFNEPMTRLPQLVHARKVCHAGERVLAWQADNLQARLSRGGLKEPDRRTRQHKIDAIVAVLMALHLWIHYGGQAAAPSYTPIKRL